MASESEKLERGIAGLEGQRETLGDDVVDAMLKPLQEKLAALEAQEARRQQRKLISILFADVSGFTAMSEQLDAEEVTETVNALWQRLDQVILRYGGVIDKHIGDAVMALWGADAAHENDPERCIRAALEMQEQLRSFAADGGQALNMRIGINTGLALLGEVGLTSEFTAIGDAVNVASRLEHAAPVGGVLVSHDTYRHVRGIFDAIPQEPLTVKGKSKPIQSYVIVGAHPHEMGRRVRGVEGIETPMVGRDSELMALREAYHAAATNRAPMLITVVGEAGVGKSRLLAEFTNWLGGLPGDQHFYEGRATLEAQAAPYGVLRDLFRGAFRIRETDGAATALQKFRQGMRILGDDTKADVVGHLVGYDFSASNAVKNLLGKPAFARQARASLAQYFLAMAAGAPVVLFFEDLHWSDQSSLEMIQFLMRELRQAAVLIVCLMRPDFYEQHPDWPALPGRARRLDLQLLDDEHSRLLVAEILKKLQDVPRDLQGLIVEKAEGNPYYVEELIKMLLDDGVIRRSGDQWSLEAARLKAFRIPSTLTGILQARLDRLPKSESALLQRASVIGRQFWDVPLVELASEAVPRDKIERVLNGIEHRELIFERTPSAIEGATEYSFKHAILRDVTYETVLLKLRRVYHGKIAAWLESHAAERINEYLSQIAQHYEQAAETEKAISYWLEAGKNAVQRSAYVEAIKLLEKALALNASLPETLECVKRELDIQLALGPALMAARGFGSGEVETTYARGRELCQRLGDTPGLFPVLFGLWRLYLMRAKLSGALDIAQQMRRIAEQSQDTDLLVEANFVVGATLHWQGEFVQAQESLEKCASLYDFEKHRDHVFRFAQDPLVVCLSYMAFNLWFLGYADQALRKVQDALAHARWLDHPFSIAYALLGTAMVHEYRREAEASRQQAEAVIALATAREFPYFLATGAILRGWALAEGGQFEDGIGTIREQIPRWAATGSEVARTYWLGLLAKSYQRAGRPAEGLAVIEEAIAFAERTGERLRLADLYRLQAEMLLMQGGSAEKATPVLQLALSTANEQKARSLELRAALTLAELWRQQGKSRQSRDLLDKIVRDFTEGFETADLQRASAILSEESEGQAL